MDASHSMVLDFFLAQQQTFHSQAKGAANSLPHALCDIHSLALESSRLGSLGCRDKANFRLVHQSPFHHQLICIISMLRLIVVLNQWRAIRRTNRCFGSMGSFCHSRGCCSRVGCFGSRSRQDELLRQQVQLQDQQRLQPPWRPMPLPGQQQELPSPAQEGEVNAQGRLGQTSAGDGRMKQSMQGC